MTGGAAVGDVDKDGHADLFVTRFDDSDILFRNKAMELLKIFRQVLALMALTSTPMVLHLAILTMTETWIYT